MKLKSSLFYFGFTLLAISTLMRRSTIVTLPSLLASDIIPVIACMLFFVKFILDKHSRKELVFCILAMVTIALLRIGVGIDTFIVTSIFALLTTKDIDIKKVIKLDIIIKSFFLLVHVFVFTADYLTGVGNALDYINYYAKGTSVSFYFSNPNTTGLLGTCIAMDMLFLKKNKAAKDYIVPTVIAIATFLLTASRTPLLMYTLYVFLQLIRDTKTLTIIQKSIYPILCIIAFAMVNFLDTHGTLFNFLNPLMSGRISQSIYAYRALGVNLLPNAARTALLENYIIDVFYVKCMVDFGLITMLIYYLPNLLLPTDCDDDTKRISIVACVNLFFESVIANIGFAIPFLILSDAFYNKNKERRHV